MLKKGFLSWFQRKSKKDVETQASGKQDDVQVAEKPSDSDQGTTVPSPQEQVNPTDSLHAQDHTGKTSQADTSAAHQAHVKTQDIDASAAQVVEKSQDIDASAAQVVEKPQEVSASTEQVVEKPQEVSASAAQVVEKPQEVNASAAQVVEKSQDIDASAAQVVEKPQEVSASTAQVVEKPQEVSASAEKEVEKPQEVNASAAQVVEKPQEVSASTAQVVEKPQEVSASTEQVVEKSQEVSASAAQVVEKSQDIDASAAQVVEKPQEVSASAEKEVEKPQEVSASAGEGHLEVTTTSDQENPRRSATPPKAPKAGFFKRLKAGLKKTSTQLGDGFLNLFTGKKIDDDLFEEIEEQLLIADVGIETTQALMQHITDQVSRKSLKDADALLQVLREKMHAILSDVEAPLVLKREDGPTVILMVGVNGVGKTTTIGKLAKQYQQQGHKVMLAAGDTFRAAAVEQLQVWGERNDISVIAQQNGADSASVIFDAYTAAKARGADILIADTAGRLQNKAHLMDELKKLCGL